MDGQFPLGVSQADRDHDQKRAKTLLMVGVAFGHLIGLACDVILGPCFGNSIFV